MTDPKPGIKVLPPVVYVAGLALGMSLERLWPLVEIRAAWTLGAAVVLFVMSAAMVAAAVQQFRRRGTPFDVRKAATALVTEGPYRRSRNPGYLALGTLYAGIGLLLGSLWVLLMLVPVLVIMQRAVIVREEAHLEQVFGDRYRAYKARVPRWL